MTNDGQETKKASKQNSASSFEGLIEIGIALSADQDTNHLMEKILLEAKKLSNADGGDHIIYREVEKVAAIDDKYGFKLDVPKLKFNFGEIYNLSISPDTLTAEERFKINDHIVQTIIMLGPLPFTEHLKRVPKFAGGHHEKRDSSGYPRRLNKDQMSIPARIMATTYIFEALAATDRPYKTPKKLSETVKIISFMKKDAHIDLDLFELFLTSGVYKDYAERFLDKAQIDEVDISESLKGDD